MKYEKKVERNFFYFNFINYFKFLLAARSSFSHFDFIIEKKITYYVFIIYVVRFGG